MKRILLLVSTLLIFWNAIGQEKQVFESEKINFYGYDFSEFRFIEETRKGEDITQYLLPWVDFYNKRFHGEALQKYMSKDIVTVDLAPTLELINNIKVTAQSESYQLHKDSLGSLIKHYDLKDSIGLGFVIVPEKFDKKTEMSYSYFVFFDIKSRQILMSDYYYTKDVDGYGLRQYWGNGMTGTIKKYFLKNYSKKERLYSQK